MSIFNIFKSKKDVPSPISNFAFTDEDRELSSAVRKARAERKRILELIELERAKAELYNVQQEINQMKKNSMLNLGDEETEKGSMEDKILMSLLSMAQLNNMNKATIKPAETTNLDNKDLLEFETMSDEQIKGFISSFPSHQIKMAKALPDSILKAKILEMLPVDEETSERAIKILKSY